MTGRTIMGWDDVPLFSDLEDVAVLIGKSRQTAWRLVKSGKLECVDPDARPIIVTKTHLQRWAGEAPPVEEAAVVPLRSHAAVFDAIKRSEGTGQVSDANAVALDDLRLRNSVDGVSRD